MAHTRRTLELRPETWDLTLDSVGRMKLAGDDYATAQNVANEARLFTDDAYFIQDQGIPHFAVELGQRFMANEAVLRAHLRRAARKVPDVLDVLAIEVSDFNPETRRLSGVIEITTVEGSGRNPLRTYF